MEETQQIKKIQQEQQDANSMIWGSAFIIFGFVLLLNFLGYLTWEIWQHIWIFWPLIIILSGISTLAGTSKIPKVLVLTLSIVSFTFVISFSIERLGKPPIVQFPKEIIDMLKALETN